MSGPVLRSEWVYLLDTNIVSELARARPHPRVVKWIETVDCACLALPLSAIFEIQFGIEMVRPFSPESAARKEQWLNALLATRDLEIAVPDVGAARLRAKMYATPALQNFVRTRDKSNRLTTGEDLYIAAVAIARGAVVTTRDVDDFLQIDEHFPLPGIFNPATGDWPKPPAPQERRH